MQIFDLVTILGPTATGKTSFAVHLANAIKAEIISADSRQVYRGMDIGTGKDIDEYMLNGERIPYHLVDIVDAGCKYNIYEFQSDFIKAYNDIKSRDVLPILCGGSGLYIESVLKGYKLINVPNNDSLRNSLEHLNLQELEVALLKFKNLHNTTDIDTKERAIRAIEIATFYHKNKDIDFTYPKLRPLIFGVKLERNQVKSRITQRLKQRLREGMIDEVELLIKNGVNPDTLIYYGLEYKYITQFLQKELSYNKMVEKLNVAIHQFSKRQMTWYRKMERDGFEINWIEGTLSMQEKVSQALQIMEKGK